MSNIRMRAYIKEKEIHVLYDVGVEERTIHISGECGKDLLDFVFMRPEQIQAKIQKLVEAYKHCVTVKENESKRIHQVLLAAIEDELGSNTYITGSLLESIHMLLEDGISDEVAEVACRGIKDEKKKKLMKLYCIPECKELYLQQLSVLLNQQQMQLFAEIRLLWGKDAVWQELEANQRLYLIARSKNYVTSYVDHTRCFASSLDTVNHYGQLDDETMCTSLIRDIAGVYEMYAFKSQEELMCFDLMQSVLLESNIKQCESCGTWFVPEGRCDSIYCSRIAQGETKPCTIIGALRKRAELVKDEPVYQAYTAAVKRMSKRKCRKGGLNAKQYKEWARAAERQRDQCLRGQVSAEEFDIWLDETSRLNQKRSLDCWGE